MDSVFENLSLANLSGFILDNNIPQFLITIIITLFVARFAKKMMYNLLSKLNENQDRTNYQFLRYVLIAAIYAVGFTAAILNVPAFKTLGTTVLAGAGVFALAISFASQQALSNIVSGIFIIVFKPFKVKDRIVMKSHGYEGVVEDITLRHTVIRDYENRRVIVPNSVISNETITNADYGDRKVCKHMVFGIGYNDDIKLAKSIIEDEATSHPLTIDNRTAADKKNKLPIVVVRTIGLGESSVDIKAFVWTKDNTSAVILSSDLFDSIKERFDKEGINIPYPHRTLEIINPAYPEVIDLK